MHLVYYALGVCIVNRMVAVQKTLPSKWYMHLVYYALGVCIVNGWLLYRRHCHQNGTCIQYTMYSMLLLMDGCCMHLVHVCIVNGWLLYRRHCHGTNCILCMHLVYYGTLQALGVCIVNGWLLYRRHRQQNGTRIQYTMNLEYALLIDGCCIEDTAIKMVHVFSIPCTWSMHC